ncbi:uncharacterized protein L3040_005370 [Drepanopeziza brunnea f. sp. 'multigermtubi']|uniref:uncharacterized protein n=1 Tax=Drepanopeziza brunnea f. sp. 'multigermtubi' TaxID=698441 RepID=UPI002394A34E|nr:hypothetical protein L3040_005370 [Drepanopeziza brunnea f. sp. 'multigermtubi']
MAYLFIPQWTASVVSRFTDPSVTFSRNPGYSSWYTLQTSLIPHRECFHICDQGQVKKPLLSRKRLGIAVTWMRCLDVGTPVIGREKGPCALFVSKKTKTKTRV